MWRRSGKVRIGGGKRTGGENTVSLPAMTMVAAAPLMSSMVKSFGIDRSRLELWMAMRWWTKLLVGEVGKDMAASKGRRVMSSIAWRQVRA